MSGKKVLLAVVLVIVGLPILMRVGRFLTPEALTFSLIEQKLVATGLPCSPMQQMSVGYMPNAVDGRSIDVNNVPVRIFLFQNTAQRDIQYGNNQPNMGEGIAAGMGIASSLGVSVAPNPNKKTWPVKKGKYLFLPTTDDSVAVGPVITAIKQL
jgi:hypothetical protein